MIKLKDILTEELSPQLKSLVGNILLGADSKIAQLQGSNTTEPDTKWEKELHKALDNWVGLPTDKLATFLKQNQNILNKLAIEYPELLQPPMNESAYRGTSMSMESLKKIFIASNKTKVEEIKDGYAANYTSIDFFVIPNVEYNPNRNAQSWTISRKIAMTFEGRHSWTKGFSAIYKTTVDDNFLFNPVLLKTIFKKNEQETIRIGGALKVEAIISTDLFLERLSPDKSFVHEIPSAKPFFQGLKKHSDSKYVRATNDYIDSLRK